ncbi:MAG: ribonuclease HII [Flavobacteriales bacterium]|nr:ribonuclease HII [Flavobacteriales bacterium]
MKVKPNLTLIDFDRSFIHPLAGVDEVGRGTLAGPVVAAAVILDFKNLPDDINDSKKVSKKNREIISTKILENSITSIGHATVEEIDDINILRASLLAMKRAVEGLSKKPKLVLIDGNHIPDIKIESKSIIKGDNKSLSIAAASIIAKVYRDNLMTEYSKKYPGYLWEKNSGYGTKEHLEAIKNLGITPIHRTSFKPIYNMLN